jgi:L-alanine-DL-glutamate epimerase-like enolase superfamily enzyme
VNRPKVENGWMKVTDAPGFGIELDQAMVERFRVR